METKFNLRMLNARDIAPLATILSKIGLKEFKDVYINSRNMEGVDNVTTNVAMAFDIASVVFENLEKCESHVFKFLARISGMTEDEVANLTPADLLELIVEVIRKEEFKDFFEAASRLFFKAN